MAHNGGRSRTVPRAHRPRAPTMSASQQQPPAVVPTPPLTAPLTPLRPVPAPPTPTAVPVSLQAPRPDAERACNEYVETPFRAAAANGANDKITAAATAAQIFPHPRLERPHRLPLHSTPPARHATAVTKQPQAFTKELPGSGGDCSAASTPGAGNIICATCGRCRCESCRAPRALPQRWLCDNACLCSADAVIDYASCLCCVKALWYHCSETDAGATCADEPCSCTGPRRAARWACLGALAAALPCLLCYWPLRGCQRAVEAAYARHSRAGCRCRPHQPTPEKRLLDASPDF